MLKYYINWPDFIIRLCVPLGCLVTKLSPWLFPKFDRGAASSIWKKVIEGKIMAKMMLANQEM